jgi:hypothetical protein
MPPPKPCDLLVAFDPQTDREIQGLVWENFKQVVTDPGPIDPQVIQETLDRLALQGLDASGMSVDDDLYTNEFIPSS